MFRIRKVGDLPEFPGQSRRSWIKLVSRVHSTVLNLLLINSKKYIYF